MNKQKSVVTCIIFLCLIINVYGGLLSNNKETQKLGNFYSWYKDLIWDPGTTFGYHIGANNEKVVVPLDGQWGVRLDGQAEYKLDPPLVLFGDKAGASPLYLGLTYRFGVHLGEHILKNCDFTKQRNLRIMVYDLAPSPEQVKQYVHAENIRIPLNKVAIGEECLQQAYATQWDQEYLLDAGNILKVGSEALQEHYGLESWVRYAESRSSWGADDNSGLILSHRGNNAQYSYIIQLWQDSTQEYKSLYALNFALELPKIATILGQPHFAQDPSPAVYWGTSFITDEYIKQFSLQEFFMSKPWHKKYWDKYRTTPLRNTKLRGHFKAIINSPVSNLKQIQTLYKKSKTNTPQLYPELDRFVQEHQDALVLAAYVQNEIELDSEIDTLALPDNDIIRPRNISKSPMATFLGRRGSVWEQCALLVYLLRQAGYAAAYVEAEEPLLFFRGDISRLLHLQIAHDNSYFEPADEKIAAVRFPWVAYYDEKLQSWIHLFPWIKDTKVTEGYELYGILPEGYKSSVAWIRHYLESDPLIFKHVKDDGNDTAAILLQRFVTEAAIVKGISPTAIGVHYQNIKKSFSSWQDFPKPICFEGEVKLSATIEDRDELYETVQIRLSSVQNPAKEIITDFMRVATIHNRALYVYFTPLGSDPYETRHEMILRMEGVEGFASQDIGSFNSGFLSRGQEKKVALNNTDHKVKININYDYKLSPHLKNILHGENLNTDVTYYIDKGTLAAICINKGFVTKEMLKLHEQRFKQIDRVNGDYNNALGCLTYLVGLTFFKNLGEAEKIIAELHKINYKASYNIGLSELTPGKPPGNPNFNSQGELQGQPDLYFPAIDMAYSLSHYANGSIRPDLGEEYMSVVKDYNAFKLVDGSANEHHILRTFYNDNYAISSVRLLQLAHKHHLARGGVGSGFLIFTRESLVAAKHNPAQATKLYFNHLIGLDLAKVLQDSPLWNDSNYKEFIDSWDSCYALAYMTPGEVISNDNELNNHEQFPYYRGTGLLILKPTTVATATIAGSPTIKNGGYGSRLADNLLTPSNISQLELIGDNEFKLGESPKVQRKIDNYFNLYQFSDRSVSDNALNQVPLAAFLPQYLAVQHIWDNYHDSDGWWAASHSNLDASIFFDHEANVKQDVELTPKFIEVYRTIVDDRPFLPESQTDHKALYRKLADPVDVVTGAFHIHTEDLSLLGPFVLTFKRNYSSNNPLPSELGYGWQHNLITHLVLSPENKKTKQPYGELIEAAEIDGSIVIYRQKSKDYWEVLPSDNQHLLGNEPKEDGNSLFHAYIKKELRGGNEYYYLYGADGSLRTYQVRSFPLIGFSRTRPYLHKWVDAVGNSITFEYGEDSKESNYGQLRRVVTTSGVFIGLNYDELGQLITVYTKDGRSVNYAYDEFGDLVDVIAPDGVATHYTYEHQIIDHNKKVLSTHRLIQEQRPNDRILQNIYDLTGRVTEQKTSSTIGNLITTAKFAYLKESTPQSPIAIREVSDALGNLTHYKIYQSLITQITDPLGHNIYQSWYLDQDLTGKQVYFDAPTQELALVPTEMFGLPKQLMSRIDKRGLRIDYSYNASGELSQKIITGIDLSGDGRLQTMKSSYTYNDSGLPTTITNNNGKSTHFIYGDPQYPRLVTRIKQYVAVTPVFIKEFSYGAVAAAKGLLLKEFSSDSSNAKNRREVLYEYDACGLLAKRIDKLASVDKAVETKFEYNWHNNLAREIVVGGSYTKYLHDNMDRLIGVVQCDSQDQELAATYYHYNANGELEWIQGAAHEKDYTLFAYDTTGNQILTARRRFTMDNPLALDMQVVPIPGYQSFVSQALELRQYDELGRLIRSFDPAGHVTEYSYDPLGQVVHRTVSDQLGGKLLMDEHYEYEPGGFISKIIHGDKSETLRSYTTNGLLKQERVSDGSVHSWLYDPEGRVLAENTPQGASWNIIYDDIKRTVTRQEQSSGITEIAKHDPYGNLIEQIDGNGDSNYYFYDELNRLISRYHNEETTKYSYTNDYVGNVITTNTMPSGASIQTVVNTKGDPVTTRWYNANSAAVSKQIHYVYYPNGKVCLSGGQNETHSCYFVDPDGQHLVDWEYFFNWQDPANDLIMGDSYSYDHNGKLLSYTLPGFRVSSYTYDGLGQLVAAAPDGRAPSWYSYNTMGHLIRHDLPEGLSWHKDYQSATEYSEHTVWGEHTIQGEHYKKESANSATITDLNGYKFTSQLDHLERIVKLVITGPDGAQEFDTRRYDRAGNLIELRQQTATVDTIIKRSYDAAGNILQETITYNGEEVASWTQKWLAEQRTALTLLVANSPVISWGFMYNASEQLTSISVDSVNKQLEWHYDYSAAALLKERKAPWSSVSLYYDSGGHLIKQYLNQEFLGELIWNLDGKLNTYRYQNKEGQLQAHTYLYNAQGRLDGEGVMTAVDTEFPVFIGGIEYAFDWGRSDGIGISTNTIMQEFANYQHSIINSNLYGYARPEVESFIGLTSERLLLKGEQEKTGFNNMAEQATTLNTRYDGMGRVIERTFKENGQTQLLQWDPRGRLLSVTLKDSSNTILSKWQAIYDGLDRRIQTIFTPYKNNHPDIEEIVTYSSFYDPEVEFLELGVTIKIGKQEPRTVWKVYGAGANEHNGHNGLEALLEADSGLVYGIIHNPVGNIFMTVDEKRQIHWQQEPCSAYGPTVIPTFPTAVDIIKPGVAAATVLNSTIWQGKRIDPTGFINFGARHYDPLTKRFLSCDPLGHVATPDLYSYADGDPVNNIDVDGRFVSEVYEAHGLTLLSAGGDWAPVFSTVKAIYETITGSDPFTGDPVNRYIAGLSIIPFVGTIAKEAKQVQTLYRITRKGLHKERLKKLRVVGYQEHHIIPKMQKFSKHKLVQRSGYDIESRMNKMFLPNRGGIHPTRSIHRGGPNFEAKNRLFREMERIAAKGEKENWTQGQYLEKVKQIVSGERTGLRSGDFKLNQAK